MTHEEFRVPPISTVRRWAKHLGVRPVAQMAAGYVVTRAVPAGVRRCTAPSVDDFVGLSGPLVTSGPALLERLGWSAAEVAAVATESGDVTARERERRDGTELSFPANWGVEAGTGYFLYAVTRLLRPQTVVETGVADGRSSFLILAALDRNGTGVLHSFDVDARAGALAHGHPRWRLSIGDPAATERSFIEGLRQVGKVDLFFHDSDHRYLNQMFEYSQVWPHMAHGGVLASDDVDDTRAFVDFCRRQELHPHFLFDARKILGAVRA